MNQGLAEEPTVSRVRLLSTEAPERAEAPRQVPSLPTGRALLLIGLLVVVTISGLYVLLPALAGVKSTWHRVSDGDPALLLAAAVLELLSFASYVVLFRGIFGGAIRLGWRESYLITMAGVAATRLLAAAGAGGIVLTVWALGRLGMDRRQIVRREATFLVLLYAIFMGTLVIGGVGLRTGVLPGPAPFGLTVIPAIFGATVIALALLAARFGRDIEMAAKRVRKAEGHLSRISRALGTAPATLGTGVRGAIAFLRAHPPELLAALGWWGFDIAVLFTALHAFGGHPEVTVVVMAYFVGMLANTLPVPGGIGAVDGGMIGALIGFDVNAGLAIVGVLAYRLLSFWLPVIPGVVAYVQLLRTEPVRTAAGSDTD
ncbi:MAG TPA: lysylphosphatidylglycerol synthase transmembrane domain-containing protein [Solirubrobacterales bacterium]|nr:lysylphosphatidylglycerol synthase transmembrane domain-containing protein [Solirubrobacterales bacterium]